MHNLLELLNLTGTLAGACICGALLGIAISKAFDWMRGKPEDPPRVTWTHRRTW